MLLGVCERTCLHVSVVPTDRDVVLALIWPKTIAQYFGMKQLYELEESRE